MYYKMLYSNIFKLVEHKNDNYDNVVRISCNTSTSKSTVSTVSTVPTVPTVSTIDVHKNFFEALVQESNTFKLDIVTDYQELKSDYIMNCIVIKMENGTLLASCHGLLVMLECDIVAKADDKIILLFDII